MTQTPFGQGQLFGTGVTILTVPLVPKIPLVVSSLRLPALSREFLPWATRYARIGSSLGLPAKSNFGGLGDATTSPWLADARTGVTSHLETFRGGASFLVPESAYQRFIQGASSVGRVDGLYVTTRGAMNKLLAQSGGDLGVINQKLGTFWSEPLYRVDINNPLLHNARMPSGLEQGANVNFRWGGYTSGGMSEAVLDPVPAGGFTANPAW
jgi:hypothetical protein